MEHAPHLGHWRYGCHSTGFGDRATGLGLQTKRQHHKSRELMADCGKTMSKDMMARHWAQRMSHIMERENICQHI
jgi:hypothetical protein